MTTHRPLDGLVHCHLVEGMIDSHRCPSPDALAKALNVSQSDVIASLQRLESNHGLVLHPHKCSVWMIHPFAVSPTNTWIQKNQAGWWAPCMWCALGVAVLVGGKVVIHVNIPLLIVYERFYGITNMVMVFPPALNGCVTMAATISCLFFSCSLLDGNSAENRSTACGIQSRHLRPIFASAAV